jgi:signal transduction histidine kinase
VSPTHHDRALAVALQQRADDIVRATVDVTQTIHGIDLAFAACFDPAGRLRVTTVAGRSRAIAPGAYVERLPDAHGDLQLPRGPRRVGRDRLSSGERLDVAAEQPPIRYLASMDLRALRRIEAVLYVGSHSANELSRALGEMESVARYAEMGLYAAATHAWEVDLERLRERERLATELHDSIAQRLFAICVAAHESLEKGDVQRMTAALSEIRQAASAGCRELATTLHRVGDDREPLSFGSRLRFRVRRFETDSRCVVQLDTDEVPCDLPDAIEALIIDAAIEGLRNAVKHAKARSASVSLSYEQPHVRLIVRAGGARRAASSTGEQPRGTGTGLQALKTRAIRFGGTLELRPSRSGQKLLVLRLPIVTRLAR